MKEIPSIPARGMMSAALTACLMLTAPAFAQGSGAPPPRPGPPPPPPGNHHPDRDGISPGEVIAGAVVIGGLAAILASSGRKNSRDDDWQRHGGGRRAIELCVAAVQNRSNARRALSVQRVTGVDRLNRGYAIAGQVQARYRGPTPRFSSSFRDNGTFQCRVRQGRVQRLTFNGI